MTLQETKDELLAIIESRQQLNIYSHKMADPSFNSIDADQWSLLNEEDNYEIAVLVAAHDWLCKK